MNRPIKVLCYTDTSDNTKGTLLAIDARVKFSHLDLKHKLKWTKKFDKVLEQAFEVDFINNPQDIWDVSSSLVYTQEGSFGTYEFYFEEISLIK